jgi:hypothetical protein
MHNSNLCLQLSMTIQVPIGLFEEEHSLFVSFTFNLRGQSRPLKRGALKSCYRGGMSFSSHFWYKHISMVGFPTVSISNADDVTKVDVLRSHQGRHRTVPVIVNFYSKLEI